MYQLSISIDERFHILVATNIAARLKTLIFSLSLFIFIYSAHAAEVLYFNQDCNYDLAGADDTCEDERYNLLNLLTEQGHSIDLLNTWAGLSSITDLSSYDVIIVPELEDGFDDCDVNDVAFLSAADKLIIQDYVNAGGSFLIAGSTQTAALLNDLFAYNLSVTSVSSTGDAQKNETAAAGTPFQDCPATIPNLTATFLVTTSMPNEKLCIYESSGNASVAFFSYGSGDVAYIGYDFNNVGTACGVDAADWTSCILNQSITTVTVDPVEAIPTLSEWALLILSILMMILGVTYIRTLGGDYLAPSVER